MFRTVFNACQRITFVPLQTRFGVVPTTPFSLSSQTFYDKEIGSTNFFSYNKKYYVDVRVRSDDQTKYLKISELSKGRRSTVMIEKEDVEEFVKVLINVDGGGVTESCIPSMGPNKTHSYHITMESNKTGPFIKVKEDHGDKSYSCILSKEVVPTLVSAVQDLNSVHLKSKTNQPSKLA